MKRVIGLLLKGIAASIIMFMVFAWWVTDQADQYQNKLGPEIRQTYGFSAGTPLIKSGEKRVEVLAIYPDKQGLMDKAGFKSGDIILSHSLTGLYKSLSQSEGTVVFIVAEGGDGHAIDKRKTREIRIDLNHQDSD